MGLKKITLGLVSTIATFGVIAGAFMPAALGSLSKHASNTVEQTYTGRINDAGGNWLTDDYANYRIDLRNTKFSKVGNDFKFTGDLVNGEATLHGVAGVKRKNKGILGWLEKLVSVKFRETVALKGTVTGTLTPIYDGGDLRFKPTVNVDFTKAHGLAIGKIAKFSIRGKLEKDARERIAKILTQETYSVAELPDLIKKVQSSI
ncbi:MAG: hypothetical protein AAFY09_09545 [Pseudomonadota bacterium]